MRNSVAKVLRGIANTSFIIGFIGGIILGNSARVGEYDNFNVAIMFYCWIGCFVEGMLFYAISEIIELQEANVEKSSKIIYLLQDIKSLNTFDTKSAKTKQANVEMNEQYAEPFTWTCTNCGELNLSVNDLCKKCKKFVTVPELITALPHQTSPILRVRLVW